MFESVGTCDHSPVEKLNLAPIESALLQNEISVELHAEIDSTNRALSGAHHRHRHVVLAEYQTAGRGRRGRSWLSPPFSGLCLSFGYEFDCGLQQLGPLSLAVGIAVAETLRAETGQDIQIKWPNDLMREHKKLGGLLIEIQTQTEARTQAIIGLGLNIQLPPEIHRTAAAMDDAVSGRGWIDLQTAGRSGPMRNRLAIALSIALDRACHEYGRYGFSAFQPRWPALDYLTGLEIQVTQADGSKLEGKADGIHTDGALWLDTTRGRLALNAAEVSVRGR